MQSLGLALTLSLLTGTLMALDLSEAAPPSPKPWLSPASVARTADASGNALAIMPNTLPGIFVPRADIGDGVFSIGSSTGKEGLEDDDNEAQTNADAVDDRTEALDMKPASSNGFVLI